MDFYSFQAYCLAAAGIAEFKDCSYADEIVTKLFEFGFGVFDAERQEQRTFFKPIVNAAWSALIETDHNKVIAAITNHLPINQDESIAAAKILGQIGAGNSDAIKALIKLLTSKYYITRRQAAKSIKQIGTGNIEVIDAVTHLLRNCSNDEIRLLATNCLEEIAPGKPIAIKTINELSHFSQHNKQLVREASLSFLKLPPGNPHDLNSLIYLLSKFDLIKKSITDLEDISILIGLLGRNLKLDKFINELDDLKNLIEILTRLETQSSKLIDDIINNLNYTAMNRLKKVLYNKPNAISIMIQILYNSQDDKVNQLGAWILGEAAKGSLEATHALMQILTTSAVEVIRYEATEGLKKILQGKLFSVVVTSLKACLTNYVYKHDHSLYKYCYEVIWHCAQNMPYQEFYTAWQGELSTVTPSVNCANLPQLLEQAIKRNNLSQDLHLICIDGSKFIDQDNPSAKIYTEMLKQGCGKCEDGTPKNMPDLQAYWDLLGCDRTLVLVLYQQQPFSNKFLDAISKFDGAICIFTDEPVKNPPLQQFSASQPQLIENITGWIRGRVLKS